MRFMNKKFLCFLLCLTTILAFGIIAYADESSEDTSSVAQSSDLPDIDIYSWELVFCNKYNSIGPYSTTQAACVYGDNGVDIRIYDYVVELVDACRSAGYPCYVNRGNRNWSYLLSNVEYQLKNVYDNDAYEMSKHILLPGCNEHQTGLCIDITADPTYSDNWNDQIDDWTVTSDTWQWMKEHCAEYGFIIRYPEGKESYYGIACCPTHIRYVGKEAATYIMENDLCLEEFLMLYGYPVNLPN